MRSIRKIVTRSAPLRAASTAWLAAGLAAGLPLAAATAAARPAIAQQAPVTGTAPNADEGIVVQGTGEVSAKPDIARVTLGVETRNAEAARAAEENATRTDAVIRAIRAAGVAEKDVQTSGYNLFRTEENVGVEAGAFGGAESSAASPQARPQQQRRRVVYVATNTVRVTVRKVADAGKMIDAAVKAGANVAGGIDFDFADPKPLEDEALRLAMEDAARKGKVLARAAGYGSLRLANVAEQGASIPRPFFGGVAMASERADMAPPTRIEPGEQKVVARITVRYVPSARLTGPGIIGVR